MCKYRLVRGGQFKLDPLWATGIWVGRLELTDEQLVLPSGGTAKARSVQQVPDRERAVGPGVHLVMPWTTVELT